jgi:hypothetical protein
MEKGLESERNIEAFILIIITGLLINLIQYLQANIFIIIEVKVNNIITMAN